MVKKAGMLSTALAAATVALSGCGNSAEAKDNVTVKLTEATYQLPADQMGCLRIQLETRDEIAKCMRDVTARDSAKRQAEIAELDKGLENDAEIIAAQEEEIKQLETTIDVLTAVRDASREAVEAETDNPTQ